MRSSSTIARARVVVVVVAVAVGVEGVTDGGSAQHPGKLGTGAVRGTTRVSDSGERDGTEHVR